MIRARETMEASQIQGSEPHFLGLRDFGFSKSAKETFRIWGHDEALRRMVLKIRELRPDVIITNHDTGRGHGHHQATGRLILEAFDAATDPQRFPEQLQKLTVWQPSRLFVRGRSTGAAVNTKVMLQSRNVSPWIRTSEIRSAGQCTQSKLDRLATAGFARAIQNHRRRLRARTIRRDPAADSYALCLTTGDGSAPGALRAFLRLSLPVAISAALPHQQSIAALW